MTENGDLIRKTEKDLAIAITYTEMVILLLGGFVACIFKFITPHEYVTTLSACAVGTLLTFSWRIINTLLNKTSFFKELER